MYVIGGAINTSIPGIDEIVSSRDEKALLELARNEARYGAQMIGLNCGTRLQTEKEDLLWLAKVIQDNISLPLCIDSLNPDSVEAVLKVHRHGRPVIDSLSCEESRIETFLPIMKKYDTAGICLLMGEGKMPFQPEERIQYMERIIEGTKRHGIKSEDIFIDPLVFALATGDTFAKAFLDTLRLVKSNYPEFKTCCGLDNISHGLPNKESINEVFLTHCYITGIDAVMIIPTRKIGGVFKINELIMGNDEYCMEYISACRAEDIE